MSDRGILSSLRYLFADFIGEDDDTPPFLPEGLPEPVMAAASDAIHLLIDYQGTELRRNFTSTGCGGSSASKASTTRCWPKLRG